MFGLTEANGPVGTWEFWRTRWLVHARFLAVNGAVASAVMFTMIPRRLELGWLGAVGPMIVALLWSALLPLTGATWERTSEPSDTAKSRRITQAFLVGWGLLLVWLLPAVLGAFRLAGLVGKG